MTTNTKYFGEIDYSKSDILTFPEGLFGFEDSKEYLLIHFEEHNHALLCLQNLQDADLAFALINPFYLMPEYNPELNSEDMKALNLTDDSEVSYYVICVAHDETADSTVNLKCPVVINPGNRLARQIIMDKPEYTFRHSLKELSEKAKEG